MLLNFPVSRGERGCTSAQILYISLHIDNAVNWVFLVAVTNRDLLRKHASWMRGHGLSTAGAECAAYRFQRPWTVGTLTSTPSAKRLTCWSQFTRKLLKTKLRFSNIVIFLEVTKSLYSLFWLRKRMTRVSMHLQYESIQTMYLILLAV